MAADPGECHPSLEELDGARSIFQAPGPSDVFYHAATNLVAGNARHGD